jgi:hypothetical protein
MSLKEMIRSLKKSSQTKKLKRRSKKRKSKQRKRNSRRRLDGLFNVDTNYTPYGCKVPKSFI